MSTVAENKQKVESIFDHNPTEDELTMVGLHPWYPDYEKQVQRVKQLLEEGDQPDYFNIGLLYDRRGETKRAEEYFAKSLPWQLQGLISWQDCE
jgi:Tat protein secretion system quality control protein TatD with DNase activity